MSKTGYVEIASRLVTVARSCLSKREHTAPRFDVDFCIGVRCGVSKRVENCHRSPALQAGHP
jgi:hypothetical protein